MSLSTQADQIVLAEGVQKINDEQTKRTAEEASATKTLTDWFDSIGLILPISFIGRIEFEDATTAGRTWSGEITYNLRTHPGLLFEVDDVRICQGYHKGLVPNAGHWFVPGTCGCGKTSYFTIQPIGGSGTMERPRASTVPVGEKHQGNGGATWASTAEQHRENFLRTIGVVRQAQVSGKIVCARCHLGNRNCTECGKANW